MQIAVAVTLTSEGLHRLLPEGGMVFFKSQINFLIFFYASYCFAGDDAITFFKKCFCLCV